MSKLSEKVSIIFGIRITEGQWQKWLDELDLDGEPTRKNMAAMIFAVCEEVEKLEEQVEYLKESQAKNAKTSK